MTEAATGRLARLWGTRDWARYGSRLAIVLIALATVLAVWNFVAASLDRDRVSAQSRAEVGLERLLSAARDMETGGRGYVLVGSERYLEPYRASLASLSEAVAEARSAWTESGRDPGELASLLDTMERKRAFTAQLVETRQREGYEPARALIETGEGKALMDAIRAEVGRFQAQTRARGREAMRREGVRSTILTVISAGAAIAACMMLGWLAWHRRRLVQTTSAELAGLDDRFRTLADNIPQLCWMADKVGNLFWYNKRWYDFTGTTAEEMRGAGWRKVHDPELVDGVSARFAAALSRGEAWEDTFPLRGRDGEYRWFLSRAEPVRGPDGAIRRWFGTNTDVTQQREQERELSAARDAAEEANRAKSQFLANMSHELRTPLSAVIGYSEMLEEEVADLGEQHLLEDLAKIKSNARHLLSLINDVLDISKIEANKMEVFAETFDVADMVREVAATVDALVEKKGNRLVVVAGGDLGTMHSDVVKLRQILINLLSNAAKFTEAGDVTLSATRLADAGGDRIRFEVSDTGLGMTQEQVARLFQRFTQADASTTRRFGGTGLGLAITKAFSQMLGGEVSVESREGEGSTFRLDVPALLPPPAADSEERVATVAAAATPGEDVILVVDDDPATRDLLSRFLAREGFTVRVAEDGRSGLALARTLKPRVILLDVTMPRMDGWTVLRALKSDPHLAAIPVVMCTIIDEQNLGFSLGASDYLLKPVNWERLRETLKRVKHDAALGDVLIVEDDPDTRGRLRQLLARNGWTVSEAGNGIEGLAAARLRTPSLVLLDLTMPEMDGFTFLREFRSHPAWADLPVVVMTARDLSAGERAELTGGGARVLQKGRVTMQDLVRQLRVLHTPGPLPDPAAAPAAGTA